MGKLRPFVRKDSYMPNKKWIPFVIGNGYTTTDGASGPAPEYETVTGNPVSFNAITPFPLRQLKVAFSPVQDLHGYDSPWPAGGGANKLPTLVAGTYLRNGLTATVKTDGTVTITGTAVSDNPRYFFIPLSEPLVLKSGMYFHQNSTGGDGLYDVIGFATTADAGATVFNLGYPGYSGDLNKAIPAEADGVTVTALRYFINSVNVERNIALRPSLDYTQTAPAAWTPYSNECPISGWSSLNVEQRGKNLFAPVAYAGGTYNPTVGTTWTLTEITGARAPVISADKKSFAVTSSANNQTWTFIQPIIYGEDYYMDVSIAPSTSLRHTAGYLDKDFKVLLKTNNSNAGTHTIKGSLVPPQGAAYRYLLVTNAAATTETITFNEPYLVFGDSEVEYVPYNGRSISISLGQTVYSGWVDVVTGVVTVEWKYLEFDGSDDENWTLSSAWEKTNTAVFYAQIGLNDVPYAESAIPLKKCNMFPRVSRNTIYSQDAQGAGFSGYVNNCSPTVRVLKTTATNLAEFTAFLSNNHLQYVYQLKEPLTIQLTPQEVQSLLGVNNMWSTANGDLTVEYRSN